MSKQASRKVKKTFEMSTYYKSSKAGIKEIEKSQIDYSENEIISGKEHGEPFQVGTTAFRKARVGYTDWVIVFEEDSKSVSFYGIVSIKYYKQ